MLSSVNDNDTSVATTAFVQAEISDNLDTSAELRTILGDETGAGAATFADSPTFADDITIHATGVKITGDGDGALTFLGLGDGSDEDFTLNLDDTANTIAVSTSTGVTKFDFGAIDVEVPAEAYDASNWDSDDTVPTKNDVRDKIEALIIGGGLGSGDIDTSAEIRTIVTDESGTGALIFAGGAIAAATATTPSAGDNDTSVATTAFVQTAMPPYEFCLSDETTTITTGTAKVTWRAPSAMTITAVRASLSTVSSSGIPTVDINEGGTTILSTKLTIDASELTSTSAAAAAVISDAAIADDAEITFDIDVAGTGAKGLKVKIYYTR